ncbi:penicillin-binding protein 1C [Patescibacteria group bacterium]|nr:penicillin-binding protein 1C [Patescibacteria group bacterium]MBU1703250.1 penicillin-binding protein 1C [Patescibacteria group bacterium]MBU1953770.1 penicillin-binding protein 1C [Patescibacteria group bacterium]
MVSVLEIRKWAALHPVWFWMMAVLFCLVALICSFYLYIAYFLPLPDPFADTRNIATTKIFDRNGVLLYEVLLPESGRKTFIPLEKMPQSLIDATLAAEDINFYSHPGVDILAIGRAVFFNVREGRIVSGASTITQQLFRNMLGRPNKNIWDKAMEAIYAVRLSNFYSKDEILELYLNKIYFGNLSYGVEAAAQNYFGRHVYDLDLAQITFIAGLPQSPSLYDPYTAFSQAKNRQKYVLDQMVKQKFLVQADADSASAEAIDLQANRYPIKAPHFVHHVLTQLEDLYGEELVHRGGLNVVTTLDYNLQQLAERTIDRHIALLDRHNVTNGSLISMDVKTGQILAWVGSANYFDDSIDGAVDMGTALRQPGSSIKPLTYLLAFEKGYNPATIIYDIPTQFSTETGPYSPKNYDLDYHGPVRVRTALASSFNIPAVKTLDFVGVGNFIAFLKDLGIATLTESAGHYGLALTLGGGEVRLIDMAQAYNVLANYGFKFDYSTISKVETSDGTELYSWTKPVSSYVLGPHGKENSYLVIDILKDPLARIPGFGEGGVLEISHPAAVKTGTTRNFKDNWTIGFSPQLLTAVWVGNADASPMENVSGIDGAAPIWADFMGAALATSPKVDFQVPDGIVQKEICALSGKLPTEYCKERLYEFFSSDNLPKETDDYYQLFTVDKNSGSIIPDQCKNQYNPLSLEQKVLVAYPPELQKWATSKGLALPHFATCAASSDYSSTYANGYTDEQSNLIIVDSPANNDEFILSNLLPPEDQKVPLRVTPPKSTLKVNFYIDNVQVGTQNKVPYTYLWLPQKGIHSFYAETELENGTLIKSPTVSFSIL